MYFICVYMHCIYALYIYNVYYLEVILLGILLGGLYFFAIFRWKSIFSIFVCFFYSCIFERTHLKLAFLMFYVYIYTYIYICIYIGTTWYTTWRFVFFCYLQVEKYFFHLPENINQQNNAIIFWCGCFK